MARIVCFIMFNSTPYPEIYNEGGSLSGSQCKSSEREQRTEPTGARSWPSCCMTASKQARGARISGAEIPQAYPQTSCVSFQVMGRLRVSVRVGARAQACDFATICHWQHDWEREPNFISLSFSRFLSFPISCFTDALAWHTFCHCNNLLTVVLQYNPNTHTRPKRSIYISYVPFISTADI